MLKLIDINAEEYYNNAIQKMEIAAGEPLYPGDERRIFTEAMIAILVGIANKCNAACNSKFLDYAEGPALDALGARSLTTRIPATASTAVFEFTLTEERNVETLIPAGTRITTDGSIDFCTDEDLVIPAGSVSGVVRATCTEPGEVGNGYIAGSVAQLVDSLPGVESAVNTEETRNGSDEEDDDTYRERIRIAPASFSVAGPEKAYIYWAKSASPVIQDVVVSVPSACVINLYVLCKGGQLPNAAQLSLVEASCRASDRRPLGDLVTAYAPTPVTYNIDVTYYTSEEDEEECGTTMAEAVVAYIAWQSGKIGRSINPDKLRALCLTPPSGVGCTRLEVREPSLMEIGALEVGMVGTVSISKEVV